MAEKKTHFGRAGEFFAMSEILLRGWNVAVPVVDIGDDIFVINDSNKTTYRMQVKSCRKTKKKDGSSIAKFTVSRQQLRVPQEIELIYMFMIRDDASSSIAGPMRFDRSTRDLAALGRAFSDGRSLGPWPDLESSPLRVQPASTPMSP